jgi:ABC-2 type transport system permease protein
MLTPFLYTLRRMRGQILGWGLGIAALAAMVIPFYDVFAEQQEQFMEMLKGYPPEFLAFFGDASDISVIATPQGFLQYYLFSMLPILLGIFALLAGSRLIAPDEERGRLDLILAHPVSRTSLFFGRLLALGAGSVGVVGVGWLGSVLMLATSASMDVGIGEMALAFVPALAQILIYATLALLLSQLLPAQRYASMVTGVLLAASYVVASMSKLNSGLEAAANLMPYTYYQGAGAMNGLDWGAFLGLMGISAVFSLIAWWRFASRDVRVTGEGSWRLPVRLGRRAPRNARAA